MTSLSAALQPAQHLYLTDSNSGIPHMVDSGAMLSISSASVQDKRSRPKQEEVAVNGSPINTYSTRTKIMKIRDRFFTWTSIVADINTSILGSDFLSHFGLLVDPAGGRLLHRDLGYVLPCHRS